MGSRQAVSLREFSAEARQSPANPVTACVFTSAENNSSFSFESANLSFDFAKRKLRVFQSGVSLLRVFFLEFRFCKRKVRVFQSGVSLLRVFFLEFRFCKTETQSFPVGAFPFTSFLFRASVCKRKLRVLQSAFLLRVSSLEVSILREKANLGVLLLEFCF